MLDEIIRVNAPDTPVYEAAYTAIGPIEAELSRRSRHQL